jgi:NADH-quinone oxidoreductase subunit H
MAPSFLTAQFLVSAAVLLIVVHVILLGVAYAIYLERKISAYIQDRIGPNRVGFDFGLPALAFLKGCVGLGQPLADGLKFFLKEDYSPRGADKVLFTLAPIAIIIPALIGFAVIPWGGVWNVPTFTIPVLNWQIAGGPAHVAGAYINVGVIYLLAVASLGIYGVTLGGWASNNKYSFLGALRASAQMISYEIPMGASLLAVLLLVGSLMPERIISYQVQNGWLMLSQPIACAVFFICILAEANRAPFDNAECEQELVGGYHTEYSSMRFALFFMAEYSHMFTSSAFFALLFLGGYHLPLVAPGHWLTPEATGFVAVLLKFLVYFTKVVLLVCFMMVVRWTLPRLRFDQVMQVGWQAVIPLSLVVVVATAVMVAAGLSGTIPMLVMNIGLCAATLALMPMLPKRPINRRVRLAGSRFWPAAGEAVVTAPSHPMAREDRPVEGGRAEAVVG